MKTEKPNSQRVSVGSSDLVLPLRVIDLDSPFFWGIARDMTDEERADAERHGRHDNPPMSVLGITNGLAAVEGKDLAQLLAAAPELLAACEEALRRTPESSKTIRPMLEAAIRKASGQNAELSGGDRERHSDTHKS